MDPKLTKPQISVIIPSYNAAHFLPAAFASIHQQQGIGTAFDLDLCVIDDGSTDDTQRVVQQYPDVQYVYQPNQGVSAARNTGIRRANGNFLTMLDSDDRWAPDTLLTLLSGFMKNPALQIVGGQVEYHFADPSLEAHYALHRTSNRFLHIGSRLYRKAVFDIVGLFDEQFECSEDLDFYNRAVDANLPVLTVPKIVLHYYVHGQNISLQQEKVTVEIMRILRKTLLRRREALLTT